LIDENERVVVYSAASLTPVREKVTATACQPSEGHRDKSESAFAVVKTAPTIHTPNDESMNEAHSSPCKHESPCQIINCF
jgi:hypothetical protein